MIKRTASEGAWRQRLLRRIGWITGRPDRAEDYLHSAFIRLEKYRSNQDVQHRDGLLVRIAANIAVDEERRRRVRSEVGQSVHDLIHIACQQPLPDEVLETQKRLERVRSGLDRLPARTRDIFLMHRVDGLKYREIALRLEISVSAVEKHIAKAALSLCEWTEGW